MKLYPSHTAVIETGTRTYVLKLQNFKAMSTLSAVKDEKAKLFIAYLIKHAAVKTCGGAETLVHEILNLSTTWK